MASSHPRNNEVPTAPCFHAEMNWTKIQSRPVSAPILKREESNALYTPRCCCRSRQPSNWLERHFWPSCRNAYLSIVHIALRPHRLIPSRRDAYGLYYLPHTIPSSHMLNHVAWSGLWGSCPWIQTRIGGTLSRIVASKRCIYLDQPGGREPSPSSVDSSICIFGRYSEVWVNDVGREYR